MYNKKIINPNICCSSKLHYNIETKKYSLYVPEKVPIRKRKKRNICT